MPAIIERPATPPTTPPAIAATGAFEVESEFESADVEFPIPLLELIPAQPYSDSTRLAIIK
jgi:hypothetical protein